MENVLSTSVELTFPCLCHVRIIAQHAPALEESLRRVVQSFGFTEELKPENRSAAGRYASFSLSVMMPDKTTMHRFDAALAAVPGVKMVL